MRQDPKRQAPQLCFIRRAFNSRDRWSGHIAFPGGKIEPTENSLECAVRETMEEIGLDLQTADHVGQLDDHISATNNMTISIHGSLFIKNTITLLFILRSLCVSDI
jgi:8-oxo-dGTP pyrophosphatase MutT (NUDIX family)